MSDPQLLRDLIGQQWIGPKGITREVIAIASVDGAARVGVWTHGTSQGLIDLWPPERYVQWRELEIINGRGDVARKEREAAIKAQADAFAESIRGFTDQFSPMLAGRARTILARPLATAGSIRPGLGVKPQDPSAHVLQALANHGWRPSITAHGKFAVMAPDRWFYEIGKIHHDYLAWYVGQVAK